MKTVRDLLNKKTSEIYSVAPDSTVFDALVLMAEKQIGATLVLRDDALVGIFSERDYARKVALDGKSSKEVLVSDIMTEKVFIVEGTCSIEDCMQTMSSKRIRHLPVFEAGKLIGVVSIGDILKSVLEEKEFVITQLEQYISGGGRIMD
jgi:CBS domain-containing protein